VRPQDLARLVALAAAWGGSYLFMRQAVPHLGPVLMIEVRVLLGGLLLLAFLVATRQAVGWRKHWKAFLFVGPIGIVVPFVLIAQALTQIDASTAAILNALAPLWAAIVAAIWIKDPLTPAKLGGIALCLVGTVVLLGWTPKPMTGEQLFATLLSVLATAIYGFTIVFTKVHLKEASPMGTSAGTLLLGAAVLAPFVFTPFAAAPHALATVPSNAWLAVVGLAVISTAIAFILYYRLIADVGPVKAITTTLLVPVFGMIWGVIFLGEPVTPGRIAGCAIILCGCSLILGLLPRALARTSNGGE